MTRDRRARAVPYLIFLGAVLCAGAPALAARQRIPITGPGVISTPGYYILPADVIGTGKQALILDASAGPIDIELNGYGIYSAPLDFGVKVTGSGLVALRNGFIWAVNTTALNMGGTATVRLSGIDLNGDSGIDAEEESSLEMTDCTLQANGYGLFFGSRGDLTIRGSSLASANDPCNFGGARILKVDSSTCTSGYGTAMFIGHSKNGSVTNSVIAGGLHGVQIWGDATRFNDNTVSDVNYEGIAVHGSDCVLSRNAIGRNGSDGVVLYSLGNVISGNAFKGNGGCGVRVIPTGPNFVQGNSFPGNGGADVCYGAPPPP